MIDTIMYINENAVCIYYADGSRLFLQTDDGTAVQLLERLLAEPVRYAA